ncbi:MAG: type II secretion system protein [Planctomycetota bacterium]
MQLHGRSDRHPRKTGFTLVEILIVIVILGVLAAITAPLFGGAAKDAAESAAKAQLQAVRKQVELYRMRNEGVSPPESGDNGLDGLWGALMEDPSTRPAFNRVPELPREFEFLWQDTRLNMTYSGEDERLKTDVPRW